ncbi:MAG: hypothetical protein LBQ61_01720 [Spirochaetales bacterium]|jgi:hypothetical protein|nr:hypothetical protein [Spirochaetales bacterium]
MRFHLGTTHIPGIEGDPLPLLQGLRQIFPRPVLPNPPEALLSQMDEKLNPRDFAGKRIALGVGSRRIAGLAPLVRAAADKLKSFGAAPFIFPAMGSHGGGQARGQLEVLEGYGITQGAMGVPILSETEVERIGALPTGTPVYLSQTALKADGVVVINRIKPHTDFKGPHESGLVKMLCIGLGNHPGATALHSEGFDRMAQVLPQAAAVILGRLKLAFALAVVENGYEETAAVEVVLPPDLMDRDRELLVTAKGLTARLLMPRIDLLVLHRIGKDISGAGMDPNIVGRMGSGLSEGFAQVPPIGRIAVLGLSRGARGNGNGIGLADVCTRSCAEAVDWGDTYTNCIASTVTGPAKLPMVFETDRLAVLGALRTIPRITPLTARIVVIPDTLHLGEIQVSPGVVEDLGRREDVEILSAPQEMAFSPSGELLGKLL